MKKIISGIVGFMLAMVPVLPMVSFAGWFDGTIGQNLDNVYNQANKNYADRVQDTGLDDINPISDSTFGEEYTVTGTIQYVINHLSGYLQYVVYAGLVLATIFLIINTLQLITASDKGAQMKKFKDNGKLIIIGVIILVGFYYIVDLFVSLTNVFF